MKLVCLPVLVFVVGLSNGQLSKQYGDRTDDTLLGKENSCKKYPFMASVTTDTDYLSGSAVIINENWLLTAAIVVYQDASELGIRVGSIFYNKGGQFRKIKKRIIHEQWSGYDYNIAVLKVSEPIEFGRNVKPITLGTKDLEDGTKAYSFGWSVKDELGLHTSIQLNNNITVLSRQTCKEVYNSLLTKRVMCAIDNRIGAGFGDRGEPLVVGNTVYGLYIGGYLNNTSLYADVPNLYKWVQQAIKRGDEED